MTQYAARGRTRWRSRRWRTLPRQVLWVQVVGRLHPSQHRQLDEFKAIADRYRAQLRLTRLRPSGRGADVWDELHPTSDQQRQLYDWLVANGDQVLTGDLFFHLAAYGDSLPGLNLCGAGRVVCLIDPSAMSMHAPSLFTRTFLPGTS